MADYATCEKTSEEVQLTDPKKYKVIMHNDNKTTFEFVIYALYHVFQMEFEDAVQLTQDIHQKGSGVAGVYEYEIAEMKTEECITLARLEGYPLQVTFEEE